MDFEWLVPKLFNDISEKTYINQCCVGGDEILELIKSDIASTMKIDAGEICIYQEDWGWALEFTKNEIVYLLAVSNCCETKNDRTLFSAYTEAARKEKSFFGKIVDAGVELDEFSKCVEMSVDKNGFAKIR